MEWQKWECKGGFVGRLSCVLIRIGNECVRKSWGVARIAGEKEGK